MSEDTDRVGLGRTRRRLGAWAWVGIGLIVGAIAGLAASNLPAGFGVGAALGITFAYALSGRNHLIATFILPTHRTTEWGSALREIVRRSQLTTAC